MSDLQLPPNMMTVTTTITNKIGDVERTLSTVLLVQTHRIDELTKVVRLAWAETTKQERTEEQKS